MAGKGIDWLGAIVQFAFGAFFGGIALGLILWGHFPNHSGSLFFAAGSAVGGLAAAIGGNSFWSSFRD